MGLYGKLGFRIVRISESRRDLIDEANLVAPDKPSTLRPDFASDFGMNLAIEPSGRVQNPEATVFVALVRSPNS
jgi:hypothetical protein